ncbi:MAG TPA: hypothetical protein VG537_09885 [Candidatus Kapabacteria bacterium]|nr:hypothetical protein [Candidatus Kapabacteria bacterium]
MHTATFQNWIIDVAGKESSYLWYGFIELKGNRFAPCSFIILDTAYHYKIVADNRLIVSGSFANEGEWPTLTLSRAIKLNSSEPFFNSNEEITILKVLHQRDLQLNSEGKNRQLC